MVTDEQRAHPFYDETDPRFREAWDWLLDIGYIPTWDQGGMVERGMATSSNVIGMIDSQYEGGWSQFTTDTEALEEWYVVSRTWLPQGRCVTEKSNFGRTRSVIRTR